MYKITVLTEEDLKTANQEIIGYLPGCFSDFKADRILLSEWYKAEHIEYRDKAGNIIVLKTVR
jgi:hypothetical protein